MGARLPVRLGCQTNSWPVNPKDLASLAGVLSRIKSFGFEGFETSFRNVEEHFGRPAELRNTIAGSGLVFLGVHIFLQQYDPLTNIAPASLWRKIVDGCSGLGAERLILSGATAAPGGVVDKAALQRKCDALNEAARYAKLKGMRLAYHNHGAEFAGGGAEMEGLYNGTDAKLVHFIFDTGHARRAKVKVPEFFSRHSRRIDAIHLRDLSDRPGDNPDLGPFDLRALTAAIAQAKWSGWLVVEEENAVNKSGDDAVRPAREALRDVLGF